MKSDIMERTNRRHLGVDIPKGTYDKLDSLQSTTYLNKWVLVTKAIDEYFINNTPHNSEINAN